MKKYLLQFSVCVFLFFVFASAASAQYVIIGTVTDASTEEPIPFANIFFKSKTTGTATDFDGNFKLTVYSLSDSLFASSVGYVGTGKSIQKLTEQTINFQLSRTEYLIGDAVVYPGENPAEPILRKIIEQKPTNNYRNLDNYKYESYNKLEIDFDNISEGVTNAKLLKKIDFIFDNIDSSSEDQPFLPMMMTETLSDIYYRSEPYSNREIIKAGKISGVSNQSVREYLGSMYLDINVYENWINILGRSFVSPIADGALTYYKYYLMDTANIEGRVCFKLTFKPKFRGESAFNGDLWVDTLDHAIKQISMQISDDVNVNFVDRASVFQQFYPVDNTHWMMTLDKLIIDFKTTENSLGIIGRKTTSFKDYVINNDSLEKYFTEREGIAMDETAYEKTDSFWQANRHDTLSENEQSIYHMIDTLKNLPYIRSWVDIVTTITTGYLTIGPIEWGPYFKLYSHNPVEGHRFRLGARTSNDFSSRIELAGYAAYGLTDERFKYGAEVTLIAVKKPRVMIGVSWKDDLDLESKNPEEFSQENLFSGFYRRPDLPQKLLHTKRYHGYFSREWKNGITGRLSFTSRNLDPYFNFYYLTAAQNEFDTISSFQSSEVSVAVRYAYEEKFLAGVFDRTSLGSRYPIVIVKYTRGFKDFFGGEYYFHSVDLTISDNLHLNPFGTLEYNISAGKIWGAPLPYLLLEVHKGNETYFVNKKSFNLMNDFEFASDIYVSGLFTQRFQGLLLNRIPLIRKLKWRNLATFKFVWGYLHSKNENANALNYYDPENPAFADDEKFFTGDPFPLPYMETSIGIENIFKLFRVDAIWRLSHRNNPHVAKFGVRVGMEVRF